MEVAFDEPVALGALNDKPENASEKLEVVVVVVVVFDAPVILGDCMLPNPVKDEATADILLGPPPAASPTAVFILHGFPVAVGVRPFRPGLPVGWAVRPATPLPVAAVKDGPNRAAAISCRVGAFGKGGGLACRGWPNGFFVPPVICGTRGLGTMEPPAGVDAGRAIDAAAKGELCPAFVDPPAADVRVGLRGGMENVNAEALRGCDRPGEG